MTRRTRSGRAFGLVALALFVVAAACERAPEASVRVVLLGDSITAGRVSEPLGPPYTELLGRALGPEFELVTLGCGGSTARDWTRSRGSDLCGGDFAVPNLYEKLARPALPADVVTVLLGTNDALERVAVADYEAALREVTAALLADGAGSVLLMTPPVVSSGRVPRIRLLADYDLAVQRICDEVEGARCGPTIGRLLGTADFAHDNIHPNGAGHAKIATALAAALRALQAPDDASSDSAAASSAAGSSQSASAPASSSSRRLP
ncbi:MAG: SGNH/GDSL hydrolase family protein [Myxococcota bacterium]